MPLSIYRNSKPPAVLVANPVFFISPTTALVDGSKLSFEVFEADAAALKELVNTDQYFVVDSDTHFFGRLESLEPCASTREELSLLRDRLMMRGLISVFREKGTAH